MVSTPFARLGLACMEQQHAGEDVWSAYLSKMKGLMEGDIGSWAIFARDATFIYTALLGPRDLWECASTVHLILACQDCKQCYNDCHSVVIRVSSNSAKFAALAVSWQAGWEPCTRLAVQRSRLNFSADREKIYPYESLL